MVPLHDSTVCRLLFLSFAFGISAIAVLAFGIVSELKVTIFGLASYVEVMFSVWLDGVIIDNSEQNLITMKKMVMGLNTVMLLACFHSSTGGDDKITIGA